MPSTTVTTSPTETASLSAVPMGLPLRPETQTVPEESTDFSDVDMPSFIPGQCLFCPNHSPYFADSVVHMQKLHGLFIPYQQHLAVDLETLFKHLHLIIFGYQECIQCGTERATLQAVQQHMTSKGHCRFDVLERDDSEFAEFYDFSEPEEEDRGGGVDGEDVALAVSSRQKPILVDDDSIRLPSGKIISKRSYTQIGSPSTQLRRRICALASNSEQPLLEPSEETPDDIPSDVQDPIPDGHDMRVMSRREKRGRAAVTYQLANMSANDRNSLVHLPASQQRAIIAAQHRHAEKAQKEERRRQGRIDRKGNKNLYAYWQTETPVYLCG